MTLKNTNASIKIKSVVFQNGEKLEIDMVSDGSYYIKNNNYYILYNESKQSELDGTTTIVKTDGTSVWVNRRGSVKSNMVYSVGKKHTALYKFNFGALSMETYTNSIDIKLDNKGGYININYLLDMGGNKSENNLNINIKGIKLDDTYRENSKPN